MSVDQGQQSSQFDWFNEQVEIPPRLTLGQMIDGFDRLSESDKSKFLACCGLVYKTAASLVAAPPVAQPPSQTNMSVPTVSVQALPVPALRAGVAQPVLGTVAKAAAASGRGGVTMDPKSGKIYQISPKKIRSQSYVALENQVLAARSELLAFLKANNLRKVPQENQYVNRTGSVVALDGQLKSLHEALGSAIEAEKSYKRAHPEEFRAPPVKGKGKPLASLSTPSGVRPGAFQVRVGRPLLAVDTAKTPTSAGVAYEPFGPRPRPDDFVEPPVFDGETSSPR